MNNRLIIYYEGSVQADPAEVQFIDSHGNTIDGLEYLRLEGDARGDWSPINTNHIIQTAKKLDFALQEIHVHP